MTYDSSSLQDGLGAQMQRVMGIFGLARALGVGYLHSGFTRIETNPGDPNISAAQRLSLLRRANELISLPGDVSGWSFNARPTGRIDWRRASRIINIHRVSRRLGQSIILPIAVPYPWCDRNPDTYKAAVELIAPRIHQPKNGTSVRVDVHIRRALAPSEIDTVLSQRYVPTEWYHQVLSVISRGLEQSGLDFVFRIHTDTPTGVWQATPGMSLSTLNILKADGLIEADGTLRRHWQGLDSLLAITPNIEVCYEWDQIEILKSMVTADLLVTCASSLSFVAGLLRKRRPVISPTFWHQAPYSWCVLQRSLQPDDHEAIQGVIHRLLAEMSAS